MLNWATIYPKSALNWATPYIYLYSPISKPILANDFCRQIAHLERKGKNPAPHFSRWSKRGDKRPPRGGGRTVPPVLRFSPAARAARLASSTPLGGVQPPALRAVPPAESIEKRVASLTATKSHSSTETSQATGFTSHPYVETNSNFPHRIGLWECSAWHNWEYVCRLHQFD